MYRRKLDNVGSYWTKQVIAHPSDVRRRRTVAPHRKQYTRAYNSRGSLYYRTYHARHRTPMSTPPLYRPYFLVRLRDVRPPLQEQPNRSSGQRFLRSQELGVAVNNNATTIISYLYNWTTDSVQILYRVLAIKTKKSFSRNKLLKLYCCCNHKCVIKECD